MSVRLNPGGPRLPKRQDEEGTQPRTARTGSGKAVTQTARSVAIQKAAPATTAAKTTAAASTSKPEAPKGFFGRLGDAIGGLFTGVASAVVGAVRNVGEGIGTFFGGIGRIFQGDVLGGLGQMGMGLVKAVVQTPVDAVLMLGGRAISAVQTMIGVEPTGRKLADDEIAELRKVYGDSIDYSRVRIKEGDAGLFSMSGRAFTHGDTIYIPEGSLPLSKGLLVHEMGHVWQHQNGGTDYMSEALWAQFFGDAYDVQKALEEGKAWSEMDPEQQAELMSDAYERGFFDDPRQPFIVGGVDYSARLDEILKEVRAGQGAP